MRLNGRRKWVTGKGGGVVARGKERGVLGIRTSERAPEVGLLYSRVYLFMG